MVNDRFEKKLWISFGVIIASVVIVTGVIYFFVGDLAAQANAIVADRATVQDQTSAVANLASLERAAPLAAQYQAAMDQILPDQYSLVDFGQWFSSDGENYGVTANAVLQDTMTQPQGTAPGSATFSFDVDGPLTGITAFLDAATTKSSGYILSFDSFDMVSDGANYKVTGQGTIFFN